MAITDEDSEQDTAISLFAATVLAVDRAAQCYIGNPPWSHIDGTDDLFEWAFWDTMYGPDGDYPGGTGMIYWDLDNYDDC